PTPRRDSIGAELPFAGSSIPDPTNPVDPLRKSGEIPTIQDSNKKNGTGKGKGKGKGANEGALGASTSGAVLGDDAVKSKRSAPGQSAGQLEKKAMLSEIAELQRHAQDVDRQLAQEVGARNRMMAGNLSLEATVSKLAMEATAGRIREKDLEQQIIDLATRLDDGLARLCEGTVVQAGFDKLVTSAEELEIVMHKDVKDTVKTAFDRAAARLYPLERQLRRERLSRTLILRLKTALPTSPLSGIEAKIVGAISDTLFYIRLALGKPGKAISDVLDDAKFIREVDGFFEYNIVAFNASVIGDIRRKWPLTGPLAGCLAPEKAPLFDYPRTYARATYQLFWDNGYFPTIHRRDPPLGAKWKFERYTLRLHLTRAMMLADDVQEGYYEEDLLPEDVWTDGYYEQPPFTIGSAHHLPAAILATTAAANAALAKATADRLSKEADERSAKEADERSSKEAAERVEEERVAAISRLSAVPPPAPAPVLARVPHVPTPVTSGQTAEQAFASAIQDALPLKSTVEVRAIVTRIRRLHMGYGDASEPLIAKALMLEGIAKSLCWDELLEGAIACAQDWDRPLPGSSRTDSIDLPAPKILSTIPPVHALPSRPSFATAAAAAPAMSALPSMVAASAAPKAANVRSNPGPTGLTPSRKKSKPVEEQNGRFEGVKEEEHNSDGRHGDQAPQGPGQWQTVQHNGPSGGGQPPLHGRRGGQRGPGRRSHNGNQNQNGAGNFQGNYQGPFQGQGNFHGGQQQVFNGGGQQQGFQGNGGNSQNFGGGNQQGFFGNGNQGGNFGPGFGNGRGNGFDDGSQGGSISSFKDHNSHGGSVGSFKDHNSRNDGSD
ncbi:hypothetical protein P7C70_g1148, partial [Phenoliferia sp. Uapishka_3]